MVPGCLLIKKYLKLLDSVIIPSSGASMSVVIPNAIKKFIEILGIIVYLECPSPFSVIFLWNNHWQNYFPIATHDNLAQSPSVL